MPYLSFLHALIAQVGVDPSGGIFIPRFDQEARFHDEVARSRWSTSQLAYIDGASSAVLRHPYTIAHAPDGELFVASFTLNHVVKLRFIEGKRAQYKVFVKGRELDGPVGMASVVVSALALVVAGRQLNTANSRAVSEVSTWVSSEYVMQMFGLTTGRSS